MSQEEEEEAVSALQGTRVKPPPALLSDPVALRCGRVLRNRIVKAATSEHLGDPVTNDPTAPLIALYGEWAKCSGCGMVVTGNVMVSRSALEAPRNVVLDADSRLALFREWASPKEGVMIMQLSHPGRQSPLAASWARPVAASSGSFAFGGVGPQLHRAAREATAEELDCLIASFGRSARLAVEQGFDGVQIHAAHGYMLSSFLTPETNHRDDSFGGSPEKRRELLLRVLRRVRREMGNDKVLCVKINRPDPTLVRAISNDEARVDAIEITGGTYAAGMECLGDPGDFDEEHDNEAIFDAAARSVSPEARDCRLIVTGGIRSCAGALAAVRGPGAPDLVGVARALCTDLQAAHTWLREQQEPAQQPTMLPERRILPRSVRRALIPGLRFGWYQRQIRRVAVGKAPSTKVFYLPYLLFDLPRALIFEPARLSPTRKKMLGALLAAAAAALAAFFL